jgi:hypothetical protein
MGVEVASDHDGRLGLKIHVDAEEMVEVGSVAIHVVVEVDEVERLVSDSEAEDLEVRGGCGVRQVGVDQAFGAVGDASVCHHFRDIIGDGVISRGVNVP